MEDAHKQELARLDGILTSAQAQIDAIKGVDTSIKPIAEAILDFASSLNTAKTDPIISATPAIVDAYQTSLGRAPETAGLEYWQDKIGSGAMDIDQVVSSITGSYEAQVKSM